MKEIEQRALANEARLDDMAKMLYSVMPGAPPVRRVQPSDGQNFVQCWDEARLGLHWEFCHTIARMICDAAAPQAATPEVPALMPDMPWPAKRFAPQAAKPPATLKSICPVLEWTSADANGASCYRDFKEGRVTVFSRRHGPVMEWTVCFPGGERTRLEGTCKDALAYAERRMAEAATHLHPDLVDAAANVGPDEVAATITRADAMFDAAPWLARSQARVPGCLDCTFADVFALLIAARSTQEEAP